MAQFGCDFTEQLWQLGETEPRVMVTNWNSGTVCVDKGTVIGTIEEVSQVGQDDHVWEEAPVPDAVVRMCVSQNSEVEHRQTKLFPIISRKCLHNRGKDWAVAAFND